MQRTPPALPKAALERGLNALVWDGVFSQAIGVLTGGTLLTGCALEFGASATFIGILAAIPFFAQFAHLPAIVLVEKLRQRRAICLAATLSARLMLVPLAAVPFVSDRSLALILLLAAFAVLAPLGAIGGCSWMSWTCDLVPHHRLGEVFGRRQLRANVSAVAAGLLGGGIISAWATLYPAWRVGGYVGVFAIAIVAALASTWCLTRMPDVPMPAPQPTTLPTLFARPFRDRNFRRLMIFLGSWQFVANLALPFCPVYLVQHLHYRITTAIALTIIGQFASIAVVPFWARLSDRWSNKTTILLSSPVFLGCLFGWALAVPWVPHPIRFPLIVALQLALGAATAGLDLACGNIALKLAPKGEATVFLGANGMVKSLCAGCAPIAGGALIARLADWGGIGSAAWPMPIWQLLFVAAGVLGALALIQLARIEEWGEVPLGALLRSVRRAATVPAAEQDFLPDPNNLPAA